MAPVDSDVLEPRFKTAQHQPAEAEISVIDLLAALLRRKRLIIGGTLAAALITAAIAYFIPDSYTAEAMIIPPQQAQSSLSVMAAGALAGGGLASQLGVKSPADLYIGLLGSRTIADDIVNQFNLRDVYRKKLASQARKALLKHVTFTAGKDTLIKIKVADNDAGRAAGIANAFVDKLYKQNSRLAITDSAQRRLFFEQQLSNEKDALAIAETALKNTQQATGMIVPAGQAETLIHAGAQIRAEIVSREVQLQAMHSFATDQNPQIQILREEISGLKSKLAALEGDGGPSATFEFSAGRLPAANLEYIRKVRDLKYHETLFELIAKQYEAARIDEAKQAPMIQIVDRAVVPDKKAWPPRLLLSLAGGLFGFLLACGWVLAARAIRNMSRMPDQAAQLRSLSRALRS